jgi:hypothetical protein
MGIFRVTIRLYAMIPNPDTPPILMLWMLP